MPQRNIIVIGDAILDHYCYATVSDKGNPEQFTASLYEVNEEQFYPGGAANVAVNAAAANEFAKVYFLTLVSESISAYVSEETQEQIFDRAFESANNKLGFNISMRKAQSPSILGFTKKTRMFINWEGDEWKYVHRLDHDAQCARIPVWPQMFMDQFETILKHTPSSDEKETIVVISDYDKGAVPYPMEVISMAKKYGCEVIVDGKKPWNKYLNSDILKVNLRELNEQFQRMQRAHLFLMDEETEKLELDDAEGEWAFICPSNLKLVHLNSYSASETEAVEKSLRDRVLYLMMKEARVEDLIITMGNRGVFYISSRPLGGKAAYFPASEPEVVRDPSGAGDSFTAGFAVKRLQGEDMNSAIKYGMSLGRRAVSYRGIWRTGISTVPTRTQDPVGARESAETKENVQRCIRAFPPTTTILFTNGCFDGLHPGHIRLFKKIKAKYPHAAVVVGLNSDISYEKVKGHKPTYSEEHRKEALEALKQVDCVIIYDNETPLEIIEHLSPNILVKGGDYTSHDQIVGSDFMKKVQGITDIIPLDEDTAHYGSSGPKVAKE